jgi:septal ring factor EnvC (AmiA/AmiB activator)
MLFYCFHSHCDTDDVSQKSKRIEEVEKELETERQRNEVLEAHGVRLTKTLDLITAERNDLRSRLQAAKAAEIEGNVRTKCIVQCVYRCSLLLVP